MADKLETLRKQVEALEAWEKFKAGLEPGQLQVIKDEILAESSPSGGEVKCLICGRLRQEAGIHRHITSFHGPDSQEPVSEADQVAAHNDADDQLGRNGAARWTEQQKKK